MNQSNLSRTPRNLLVSALGCVALLSIVFSFFAFTGRADATAASSAVTLPGSAAPWVKGARSLGHHGASDQISIGLMLKTSNAAGQQSLLKQLYNRNSASYHQWLTSAQFSTRFAPAAADVAAAKAFLTRSGLKLTASPDATMLQATGTTKQIEAAFGTTINDYQVSTGQHYFGNVNNVKLPANLGGSILGVFGLSNFNTMISYADAGPAATTPPPYGGGPYGRGLTPSQISGIYDADNAYTKLKTKGQGITLAVYELSGYKASDIRDYEKQFKLPNVKVVDKPVLGGPKNHGGAGEVELDIELQIAMAPGIRKLEVYNAPNTEVGALSEYLQIAKDNTADAISSSWGIPCEYGVNSQVTIAENQIFLQMAAQGQSLFEASGDAGAYGCSRAGLILPFPQSLQIGDANNQPYNTSVGGTAFRRQDSTTITFDPGKNQHPKYPGTDKENVWNRACVQNDCSSGAGGGGVSRIWAEPDYAYDSTGTPLPGVVEDKYSQSGTYCNQQPDILCRENPDVALDSDPSTGYAIRCTDPGDAGCAPDSVYQVKGWIRFGGTSCASPLWAGIAALADAHAKSRLGLFNYLVYPFDSKAGYASQFHDITIGDNGYYPAGPNYDLSTGIGTPEIYNLLKAIS